MQHAEREREREREGEGGSERGIEREREIESDREREREREGREGVQRHAFSPFGLARVEALWSLRDGHEFRSSPW